MFSNQNSAWSSLGFSHQENSAPPYYAPLAKETVTPLWCWRMQRQRWSDHLHLTDASFPYNIHQYIFLLLFYCPNYSNLPFHSQERIPREFRKHQYTYPSAQPLKWEHENNLTSSKVILERSPLGRLSPLPALKTTSSQSITGGFRSVLYSKMFQNKTLRGTMN